VSAFHCLCLINSCTLDVRIIASVSSLSNSPSYWSSNSVPFGTTFMIRSPTGPRRIQQRSIVRLISCVVECTVTDSPFNTQANFWKCPSSAWMYFLTRVTRELVTLRSTAALLMLLAALRIRWSSSSLVFTLRAYTIAFM